MYQIWSRLKKMQSKWKVITSRQYNKIEDTIQQMHKVIDIQSYLQQ